MKESRVARSARFSTPGQVRILIGLTLTALLPACASTTGARPAQSERPQTSIVIENESTTALRIYASTGGEEFRLGRVEGLRTAIFTFPREALRRNAQLSARIETSFSTAGEHRSPSFTILPGQQLIWRLYQSPALSDLPRLSSLSIRNRPLETK